MNSTRDRKEKSHSRSSKLVKTHEFEFYGNNPLDFASQGENITGNTDGNLSSSLVQELIKAIGDKQGGDTASSNNFPGKEVVFNAANQHHNSCCKTWLIDSGASDHIIEKKHILGNLKTLSKEIRKGLPGGKMKVVREVGNVRLNDDIVLRNVLYIDDFKYNLLFVSKLLKENDLKMNFDKHECFLQGLSIDETMEFGRNNLFSC